jgi:hypothetical protein
MLVYQEYTWEAGVFPSEHVVPPLYLSLIFFLLIFFASPQYRDNRVLVIIDPVQWSGDWYPCCHAAMLGHVTLF